MIINLLSFLVIIAICVVAHEYGHYRTAIAMGIQVHEFSFGMGPILYQYAGKKNLWSVRLFPIGGFVRLAGMEEEEEGEDIEPGMGFQEKSPLARLAVLFAGPMANIVMAFMLTAILLWGHGILDLDSTTIGETIPGFSAQKIGLRSGDLITDINGKAVIDWQSMANMIHSLAPEETLDIKFTRDGRVMNLTGTAHVDPEYGVPLLGIRPQRLTFPPIKALGKSLTYTFKMTISMLQGIYAWLTGQTKVDVSGPVGIATMAGQAAKQGIWAILSFLAIINLNLGIVNLFPFPALDGGRIIFITGELITGKRLPEKIEGYIHFAGFMILIGLIALITWKDILKLIAN